MYIPNWGTARAGPAVVHLAMAGSRSRGGVCMKTRFGRELTICRNDQNVPNKTLRFQRRLFLYKSIALSKVGTTATTPHRDHAKKLTSHRFMAHIRGECILLISVLYCP